ncbi:hypothetical protein Tco_1158292 [Tanacetum coccineum]
MQPSLRGSLKGITDEYEQSNLSEQVCLSRGDIYNDHSLLIFYQNDDTSPWGNSKHKEKREDGPEWIVRTINKSETPEPEAPTFAITSRSGISTQDPPFPTSPRPIKEAEKVNEDERLLSIFKKIHINLPFLEAMIHMPKGAKVLKDLLSHKEKLEKAVSSVKLSEECSAIIKKSLPQKEGDTRSFTLPFNIVNHDGKWTEEEEEEDSIKVLAVSFYSRTEPVEPLEWKALDNQLKPSSVEPLKLELKELHEHLEYAFLQENNQLPVVISSALSIDKKTRLLEVLRNHKGAIAWSIADIKGIDSSFCTHKILMED